MNPLSNLKLVIIVTGGIAAYKALELIRRAREAGAQTKVVMTRAAQEFVAPLSFQALSGHEVHTELLDAKAEAGMGHIELARWADMVVAVPASADFIARVGHGLADDLATTLCLATSAPVLLAPAMNQQMWRNSATQQNFAAVQELGILTVGPATGSQACGDVGPGRLAEIEDILTAVSQHFSTRELAGQRVLITAGPTQEAIDPVRYLSNRSSGKMGYALAAAALAAGAEVTLVSGPTKVEPVEAAHFVAVISAADMYDAVMERIESTDIFIAAAAVADYTFSEPSTQKRKKKTAELRLTLEPTQDILKSVATAPNSPFCVGFAAETENLVENARGKLTRKSLQMIAANDVSKANIGFDSNENELLVLWPNGEMRLPIASKEKIARQLISLIAEQFLASQPNE